MLVKRQEYISQVRPSGTKWNWDSALLSTLQRRPVGAASLFLCLHAGIWTIFAVLSHDGGLHPDMTEAYSWGREFQLGYYAHPPLWAWIAGAWFRVFPRADWAFYLLATLNSGVAVIGVWKLTGLFTQNACRLAATLLLLLLPFYTVQGHQFNANYILLSLWPWTAYFFVRSMEAPGLRYALWFGALAAAGMLSKYYTGVLLAACAMASFTHPDWRRYYASAAPYLAVAMCVLLVSPHVWWLFQNDFLPLHYLETRTQFSTARVHESILWFIFGSLAFNTLAATVVAASRMLDRRAGPQIPAPPFDPSRQLFVTILAIGPFALTVLAGIAGHARISTNFASPILFLVPLLLMRWFRPVPERLVRIAATVIVIMTAGVLCLAPAVPYFKPLKDLTAPLSNEVAMKATQIWHETTSLPLRTVAGRHSMDVTFYSGDDTSDFIDFDMRYAPWVTPARLEETGLLAICAEADESCHAQAVKFGGTRMRETRLTVAHKLGNWVAAPVSFRLFIIPPAAGKDRKAAS